jgi:TonB family protein
VSAAHWLGNLAAWSLQAAALIVAGSLAAWVFRLRVPRVRLAYWQALLALCLLLPAVEPWRSAPDSDIEFTTSAARPVPSHPTPPYSLPWRQALLIVLASGCAARALWLAGGFGKLRRWRRDARIFAPLPPRLGRLRAAIAPRAELRLSSAISGPVTFGLRRPMVVLPASFAELPADIQEAIVCHELLHVRRRDWIVTVAEQVVRAALWFHPAIWWLIGQAQLAREQIVDGEVVALTGNRAQYLNALLAMAGNRPALDLAPAALFLRKRHLKDRVALLLKEVTMSKRSLISFCAASCGVLFAAGWLALHTFPLQASPVPQGAAQSNLLHSVPPEYPEAARKNHIEGAVVLEVHIDAEGRVADAHVIGGPEELRSAALAAILQWHYNPQAMSLPATTQVTMDFKLPKDGAPEAAEAVNLLPEGKRVILKTISVEGLTPTARDALLEQLPVHQGDTVDADAVRAAIANVRAFDEHLSVILNVVGENAAILRIHLRTVGARGVGAGVGSGVASGVGSGASSGVASGVETAGAAPTRIRVGGNVQQAKLLVKVQPVYPAGAKAQGIEGIVRLQATLGKNGKVENLVVIDGDPVLAGAALDAVRQWQYQTTLLNGDPVEVVTEIDVNFTLAK